MAERLTLSLLLTGKHSDWKERVSAKDGDNTRT